MSVRRAAELDDVVRDLIDTPDLDDPREEAFAAAALELFAYQYERCAPYQRYCAAFGATPATVRQWADVPAVPTSAFKEAPLTTCEDADYTFRTSGTSVSARHGTVTRDAAAQDLVWSAQVRIHAAMMRPDGAELRLYSLVPGPEQLPEASIAYSVDVLTRANGAPGSRSFVTPGGLDMEGLYAALRGAQATGEPVEVYGATYSFVPFLDWLRDGGRRVALPAGSRLAHGSGYKGRTRELTAAEFDAYVADWLSIPPERSVDVLGMTELGSQFYDDVLRRPDAASTGVRRKTTHPWTRTRVVDPDTLADVPPGVPGLLVHYDLSLRGNVIAVLTEDLGVRVDGGFQILGRATGAEARGCNAAVEALMTPGRVAP